MGPNVEVIETAELGDRSYVVHDGEVAVVVDPQRDLDRVERILARLDLRCRLVLETHIHNDYVTGGFELARRSDARYGGAAGEDGWFLREPLADGAEREVGSLRVRAVATPGHTDHHLSYVVENGDGPAAVFTGGSLLYGSVGRTDLVAADRTDELTRAQFHSARRLAAMVGDEAQIFPTHGFGSFCSSGSSTGGENSTMGQERRRNDALVEEDEESFVARLVAGLTAYPRYYAHMAGRNRRGPCAPDLSASAPVEPAELRARVRAGEWVVDLRDRAAFAAAHLPGSIGIGLGQQFSTYLGWLVPWGMPVTLVGESPEQIAEAQRQLVRIGIERPAGAAVGRPAELAAADGPAGYPRASFDDLAKARERGKAPTVLDVRREDERAAGAIPGAANIPLHALLERLDDAPRDRLWVHCASGYRAAIAASLLARAGHDVVLIDDEYSRAVELGLATG